MYGVLYAISPEIFPAKDRGTGNGLTATATRVFGIIVCVNNILAPTPLTPDPLFFSGPCHCIVRQPGNRSAGLRLWRIDHRKWPSSLVATLRTKRQSLNLVLS